MIPKNKRRKKKSLKTRKNEQSEQENLCEYNTPKLFVITHIYIAPTHKSNRDLTKTPKLYKHIYSILYYTQTKL